MVTFSDSKLPNFCVLQILKVFNREFYALYIQFPDIHKWFFVFCSYISKLFNGSFKVATSSVAAFTFKCIQHLKVCRVLFRQFSLNSYIGDKNLSILSNTCFS